jgi:hypothetical protein
VKSERRSKLASLYLADSGFLFDPYTGLTYGLNETGAVIMKALRDGSSPEEIAGRIVREFDAPEATVVADVREFIDKLSQEGLLWVG